MGHITISIGGSFSVTGTESFSAIEGGHADAVAQAIEFLARVALPRAIKQDHELQAHGHHPRMGFGRWEEERKHE